MSPDWNFFITVLLFATPLLLAAMGELVAERAGVVNIGIEGMMLAGALAGWIGNGLAGPTLGIVASTSAGIACGLVFAIVILAFSGDQIVAGTGINLLAIGITGLAHKQAGIESASITVLSPMFLAGVVPIVGLAIWAVLRYTRLGLELIAVGEHPHAADAAGVNVNSRKLIAILFGAGCAGLAGGYLSTMRTGVFTENMTGGQGFLALAIVIFGRWRPGWVILAGLFFGALRAASDRLIVTRDFRQEYSQLLNMLPYVVTLLALAGLAGKSTQPAALGKPFSRN